MVFVMVLRITHKAGKEGHFPQAFSYIHIEKKTPVFPILFNVGKHNFISFNITNNQCFVLLFLYCRVSLVF